MVVNVLIVLANRQNQVRTGCWGMVLLACSTKKLYLTILITSWKHGTYIYKRINAVTKSDMFQLY